MQPFGAVLFAVSLSLVVVSGCATVDDVVPPKVTLVNIVPLSSSVFEQRFIVDMRVSNLNDFDIPLNGMSFEMDVNGSYFATGLSNRRVRVPRLGTAVVSLETTANSFDLFRQILNAVRVGTVEYSIRGTAILDRPGARTVPFRQKGELNLVPDPAGRDRLAPTSTGLSH